MDEGNATTGAGAAREARRRKILDRGTDRLAFITGHVKSVPPAPIPDQQEPPSEPIHGKDDLPYSHMPNMEKPVLTEEITLKSTVRDIGIELLNERESKEATSDFVNSESSTFSSKESLSSLKPDAESFSGQVSKLKMFTANRVSYCISSSENIRLLSAAAIAFLVVLSYQGSFFGVQMATSLSSRPILLVLVTDITIVLALLVVKKDLVFKDDEGKEASIKGYDVGNLINLGLVAHKATRAVFVDCCLCAVLMIIGIPPLKTLVLTSNVVVHRHLRGGHDSSVQLNWMPSPRPF